MTRMAWGAGFTTEAADGSTLDAWFRWFDWGEFGDDEMTTAYPDLDDQLGMRETTDELRNVTVRPIRLTIDVDEAPASAADAYLRLHLLSGRLARPHSINMDGIFGALNNVVWTDIGPVAVAELDDTRMRVRAKGHTLQVLGVDKFPKMLDYVVPSGVRIADSSRVRLGAHLAEGTVVMHEGFCNFNAGTIGTSMVEGRISAGVVVGDGSDIGGGASIIGTLSGGGKEVISVGERCLLGANAGIGISLGDDCTVEAGLYITAATPVSTPDGVVKARELSGITGTLFYRDGQTGQVIARPRTQSWGELNAALHAND
ncbi:2,3,4,5-tetrahydropyridine-2-carboxylate N-succinyltransferase [Ilumatobacter fluminis]|uniref:2,3,4,5-tetrahydropyridine-2,6-dicarboxylate N-succinyltransferase n=1 Tax=Ilumatobacter fluminis TaxID=467091 RepID=A0A4V3EJ98_9ACTN|nr:2,3,4,5-tetrahydropyridine-2,6-dicarboxylate N-succinyltransferase [Ilumatobacter fluminis]TDT17508.1 2,3,4,5-tetrahydropyridine-2-carboxylate N-succinyltransferase [Ilumatobacter fluminis]